MCTVIAAVGCGRDWPMLIAANRDERLDRPALPPARHWPGQPDVIGGLDILAGGTWLAVNRAGVVACVLNRSGTLGAAAGKRSRGILPLMALRHATALHAAESLAEHDGQDWRSFNMVVADCDGAYFLRGTGETRLHVAELPQGIHMVTAHDPDDMASPRVARHLPLFRQAVLPNPPDWGAWPSLLADSRPPVQASLNVAPTAGFGTVSSALLAVGGDRQVCYWATDTAPTADGFGRVVFHRSQA